MLVFPIYHRWNKAAIAMIEAESYRDALELAVSRRLGLVYADLKGGKLPGAFLEGADLRGADLSSASLQGACLRTGDLRAARLFGTDLRGASLGAADLRHADLRMADLRGADLRGARLVGADLRGVLLNAARLEGAILDWRWSVVALELLRDRLGDAAATSVLADLAFHDDERPFAWLKVLIRHHAQLESMLGVLSEHIRPGDNAPNLLVRLTADVTDEAGRLAPRASAGRARGERRPCVTFARRTGDVAHVVDPACDPIGTGRTQGSLIDRAVPGRVAPRAPLAPPPWSGEADEGARFIRSICIFGRR